MIQLHDKETGGLIGAINEVQLKYPIDQLEEEFDEDKDYYLDIVTIDVMANNGADPALIDLLRGALNGRADMEVRWTRG